MKWPWTERNYTMDFWVLKKDQNENTKSNTRNHHACHFSIAHAPKERERSGEGGRRISSGRQREKWAHIASSMDSLIHHARKAPCVLTLFCQPPPLSFHPPCTTYHHETATKGWSKIIKSQNWSSATLSSFLIHYWCVFVWNCAFSLEFHYYCLFGWWVEKGGGTVFIGEGKRGGCVLELSAAFPFEWNKTVRCRNWLVDGRLEMNFICSWHHQSVERE